MILQRTDHTHFTAPRSHYLPFSEAHASRFVGVRVGMLVMPRLGRNQFARRRHGERTVFHATGTGQGIGERLQQILFVLFFFFFVVFFVFVLFLLFCFVFVFVCV